MKRFLGILLLFTYLTFDITAFADRYDDLFNYIDIIPKYGSVSADISLENFSDFEFLEVFNEQIKPYSMPEIVNGIANSKIHIEADYKIQKKKIVKAYIKANLSSPVKMSSDLNFDTNAVFHIWVNTDYTKIKEPYYKITVKTPFSDKYFIFDSTHENAILLYPSDKRNEQIKISMRDALKSNSRLIFENNTYTISVDDSGFKNTLEYIVDNSYKYLYLIKNGENNDKQKIEYYKEDLSQLLSRLNNVKLLGNSGISNKLTFDINGKLIESSLDFEIDTNIFKIYYSANGNSIPTDPNIPRPVINAKNSDVHLKVNAKIKFSDEYTSFSSPRPAKRLIHNVFKPDDYTLEYTTTEESSSPYEVIKFEKEGFLVTQNNVAYVPLRSMLNSLGVSDSSILWNEGKIEIHDDIVPVLPFKHIVLSENNDIIQSDGIETILTAPVITIDDVVYVPEDFVSKILDSTIIGYSTVYNYDKQMYITTTEIERLKPVYYIQLKNSSFTIIE